MISLYMHISVRQRYQSGWYEPWSVLLLLCLHHHVQLLQTVAYCRSAFFYKCIIEDPLISGHRRLTNVKRTNASEWKDFPPVWWHNSVQPPTHIKSKKHKTEGGFVFGFLRDTWTADIWLWTEEWEHMEIKLYILYGFRLVFYMCVNGKWLFDEESPAVFNLCWRCLIRLSLWIISIEHTLPVSMFLMRNRAQERSQYPHLVTDLFVCQITCFSPVCDPKKRYFPRFLKQWCNNLAWPLLVKAHCIHYFYMTHWSRDRDIVVF